MKILIIDDDKNRATGLRKYLLEHQDSAASEIVIADCVDDATRSLRNVYFDAVILDVVLPKRRHEKPSGQNGISLLERISRGNKLKKPERIIGISSHLGDIEAFRVEFTKYCHAVIEAKNSGDAWKEALRLGLDYTLSSKIDRFAENRPTMALTVHGIRTFGAWQNRLKAIVCNRSCSVDFITYQYGYFSLLAFFIPFVRAFQVRRLKEYLKKIILQKSAGRFIVFCHSFGTYLVAKALKQLIAEGYRPQVDTLVLCGSVLSSDFDWEFLLRCTDVKIVNECGDGDYVLWASKALVPMSGMAGKTGFFGANDERIVNRYFSGGHSLYFEGDDFMVKYWLPLFDGDDAVFDVDVRSPNVIEHGIGDNLILRIGMVKEFAYICVISYWVSKLSGLI